jgi:prolyl oligopeptidase
MHTNLDAPNRRVVTVPLASPGLEHWETVIPEGDMPIWAELVAGRIAVLTIRNVASEIRIHRLDGAVEREIPLPGLGATGGLMGRFDRPELFYTYADPLTPHTIYRYDAARDESRPFDSPTLKFDPVLFRTDRVFFESKDGTRVPMFITRRRDLAMDGRNPTLLWGYGGFGGSLRPSFSPHVIAWIERGGVYVTANLRGGGEYGQSWHEAGRLERKQNVFDDFIAAAEYLIRERYTSPRHLAINGHSNGGLLVGAVMVQRPDLFAAAVPEIGVLDMLRYHEFTGGGLWGAEYGVATDPDAFQWLRAYSPVHNVRRGVCHPATLVMTADHDDRVVPSHSYKFAAALQAAQSAVWGCERPVLLRIESRASHSYSPLDQRIALRAHVLAFVAQHTGMAPAKW